VDAFYFGDREGPLFGLYHPPSGPTVRDAAVLLCYPIGHEQIVSHRAFTQLAIRLAAAGFPVMRFDFYGCGDSAGACEDGTPARWRRDIAAALGSLRLRSACPAVVVAGCRLGATLAAIVAAERQDITSMVLWDPIVEGAAYVDELALRHDDMLRHTHVAARSAAPAARHEFLGMALGAGAVAEIAAVNLDALTASPATRVLIVETGGDGTAALRQRLAANGARVDHQQLPVDRAWSWIEDVNKVLVPQPVVAAIVSWIAGVHP
jgi:pimeloyl-ACP methyl ester carboxylesterase